MEIVNFIIPAVSTGAVAGLLAAGYTKAPPIWPTLSLASSPSLEF